MMLVFGQAGGARIFDGGGGLAGADADQDEAFPTDVNDNHQAWTDTKPDWRELQRDAVISAAGTAAVRILARTACVVNIGGRTDDILLQRTCRFLLGTEATDKAASLLSATFLQLAQDMLWKRWAAVEAIATALMERRKLSVSEVASLYAQTLKDTHP